MAAPPTPPAAPPTMAPIGRRSEDADVGVGENIVVAGAKLGVNAEAGSVWDGRKEVVTLPPM